MERYSLVRNEHGRGQIPGYNRRASCQTSGPPAWLPVSFAPPSDKLQATIDAWRPNSAGPARRGRGERRPGTGGHGGAKSPGGVHLAALTLQTVKRQEYDTFSSAFPQGVLHELA
jgi:hypothetical protein